MCQICFISFFNQFYLNFYRISALKCLFLLNMPKKSTQENIWLFFHDNNWKYCLQKKPIKVLCILKSSCKKVWNFESLRKQDTDVHKVAWFDTAVVLSCTDLLHSSHLLTLTYLYNSKCTYHNAYTTNTPQLKTMLNCVWRVC